MRDLGGWVINIDRSLGSCFGGRFCWSREAGGFCLVFLGGVGEFRKFGGALAFGGCCNRVL